MTNERAYEHECTVENAAKFLDWLRNRGGVAIWESINLANAGASWSTPVLTKGGDPTTQPTWQCGNAPAKVVVDPNQIRVYAGKEVHRFKVGIRPGSQGMSMKVTDGGTRNIHRALEKYGEGSSWYEFDYETQEAVIFLSEKPMPLDEYAKENNL